MTQSRNLNPACLEGEDEPPSWEAEATTEAWKHWKYIKLTLEAHAIPHEDIIAAGHHYVTAFVHGWKHGVGR